MILQMLDIAVHVVPFVVSRELRTRLRATFPVSLGLVTIGLRQTAIHHPSSRFEGPCRTFQKSIECLHLTQPSTTALGSGAGASPDHGGNASCRDLKVRQLGGAPRLGSRRRVDSATSLDHRLDVVHATREVEGRACARAHSSVARAYGIQPQRHLLTLASQP